MGMMGWIVGLMMAWMMLFGGGMFGLFPWATQ